MANNNMPDRSSSVKGKMRDRTKKIAYASLLSGQKQFVPPWRRQMTVCIAALADNGKTLVLVADKMVGWDVIESELAEKIRPLHKDWRLMFAGNDIGPTFDIIARARQQLPRDRGASTEQVIQAVKSSYDDERLSRAETLYLRPIGLTVKRFLEHGKRFLTEAEHQKIFDKLNSYRLEVHFLVAGFDRRGKGNIFTVNTMNDGQHQRHESPGFAAIGSGGVAADYMMYWRNLTPKMHVREVLYYAFEAKWFGEEAIGVGEETDLYIMQAGKRHIKLDLDKTIEKRLVPICKALQPRTLRQNEKQDDINTLNSINELEDFPLLRKKKAGKKK